MFPKFRIIAGLIAGSFLVFNVDEALAQSVSSEPFHAPADMKMQAYQEPPLGPPQASFDCSKAKVPLEKLVCADTYLAAADKALAEEWTTVLADYKGPLKLSLIKGQEAWLKFRVGACATDGDEATAASQIDCLKSVYGQRRTMLESELEAHQRLPMANFDEILDRSTSQFDPPFTIPELALLQDGKVTTSQSPRSCRELYTDDAGKWGDLNDDSSSVGRTDCQFEMISGLSDPAHLIPEEVRHSIDKQLKSYLDTVNDEASYHDILKVAVGDFMHIGKDQVVAVVYSHDEGSLKFRTLYFGTYDRSQDQLTMHPFHGIAPIPDIWSE